MLAGEPQMAKAKAVLGQGKAQTLKELKDYGNCIHRNAITRAMVRLYDV